MSWNPLDPNVGGERASCNDGEKRRQSIDRENQRKLAECINREYRHEHQLRATQWPSA